MPTIMRITPTVASSIPETVVVTANLRMAPTAMRKIEVPMPMGWAYPRVLAAKTEG